MSRFPLVLLLAAASAMAQGTLEVIRGLHFYNFSFEP